MKFQATMSADTQSFVIASQRLGIHFTSLWIISSPGRRVERFQKETSNAYVKGAIRQREIGSFSGALNG
jgi:hypothetical protein